MRYGSRMRIGWAAVLLAGMSLVAAACGGDSPEPTATPAPPTSTAFPTATSPPLPTQPAGFVLPPEGPEGLAFYDPDPLPAGLNSRVIWQVEVAAPAGARAWKVLYHSHAIDGTPIAVSGFIVAPEDAEPGDDRVVVSWAHGTTGLADHCAPTRSLSPAQAIPGLADLLAAGYVVAATDYEGLGTPGVHPYIVGESAGRSVLDAARAARELPTGAGNRVLVFGHSQGGHAALFAGQIAPRHAPELEILGVVAGAPAAELSSIAEILPQTPFFGYLIMAGAGFDAAYGESRLPTFLNEDARALLDVLQDGCASEILATFAGLDPDEVILRLPTDDPETLARIEENTPGNVVIEAPVLVIHGTADDQIPAILSSLYTDRACALGTTVDLRFYQGAGHGGALSEAAPEVLAWMAGRVSGAPAARSCGAVPLP